MIRFHRLGLPLFAACFLIHGSAAWAEDGAPQPGEWCRTHQRWMERGGQHQLRGAVCPTAGVCDEPAVRDSYIPDGNTPIITLSIKFNVFANTNGSSPAASAAQVTAQLNTLNTDYSPWRIQFSGVYEQINNSTFRNFADAEEYAMKSQYADDPAHQLNVYVVTIQGGYSGVGNFPWQSDARGVTGGIIIDGSVFGSGQHILSHEVGHCIGLWHTHHGVSEVPACSECYELAGGANGDFAGDFASDTAPTPVNFNCAGPGGSDGCNAVPWGLTNFRNYMGYAPNSCINQFSPQQAGRIHCWIEEALSGWYGQAKGACCQGENCSIVKPVDCADNFLGGDTECGLAAGSPSNYSAVVNAAIPDAGGFTSAAVHTINVPDSFTVGDVNVGLKITHPWIGDLVVMLEHEGRSAFIAAPNGGCAADNYNAITLDDEGTGGPITFLCTTNLTSPPSYTPSEWLREFDGTDAAGDWTITVGDFGAQDLGTLDRWSLAIDGQLNACTAIGEAAVGDDVCEGGANHGQPCSRGTDCPGGVCWLKNRFISFEVPSSVTSGVKVTLADLNPESVIDPGAFNGDERWVGPPTLDVDDGINGSFNAAELQCDFFSRDWSTLGTLHVYGSAVVPSSGYDVSVCLADTGPCSAPLRIETSLFGDVEPPLITSQPSFLDIAAIVDKFQNKPTGHSKTRSMLQPRTVLPSGNVGFLDISTAVDAFAGDEFKEAFPLGPEDCP